MDLEIRLKHGSEREERTRAQLVRLVERHDVSSWLFTSVVLIEERAIPFSHPVLRLNTRHLDQDEVLLATFVHEQLHWHATAHRAVGARVLAELRKRYASVPVGAPAGAQDEGSSYLHLLINWLEVRAMRELLDAVALSRLQEFWLGDHYTGIYEIVLRDDRAIGGIVTRHRFPVP